jgi:hypothetical protein
MKKEIFMFTRILCKVDSSLNKILKLTERINFLLEKFLKGDDSEVGKRFLKVDKRQVPSKDQFSTKLQSMEHSQGVSGFSGSGYKGPGSVSHDKVISNRARSNFQRSRRGSRSS